jgi:hypothetical protein
MNRIGRSNTVVNGTSTHLMAFRHFNLLSLAYYQFFFSKNDSSGVLNQNIMLILAQGDEIYYLMHHRTQRGEKRDTSFASHWENMLELSLYERGSQKSEAHRVIVERVSIR